MKPILLLDVDGVVNAFTLRGWPEGTRWHDFKVHGGGDLWRVRFAEPVAEWLLRLHLSERVEIQWHTTWQKDANNIAKMINLPEWPVADAPEFESGAWTAGHSRTESWWKLPAACRVLESGRPLIWADDDITYSGNSRTLINNAARHVPRLLISPNPNEGLVKLHLDRIDGWLDSYEKTYGVTA